MVFDLSLVFVFLVFWVKDELFKLVSMKCKKNICCFFMNLLLLI